ncbi:MAG: thymidylate kinase, partial [Clostridia bacterium]|nr:thymidylate kinase [Clostridia bacterium]
MTKLILIEGIPGSGKTTLALRLEKYFNENSFTAKCIPEGDLHPADLAWCGVLGEDEFRNILSEYPEYKNQLENFAIYENGKFIIPYLALKPYNKKLVAYLEETEPYSGKLSSEDFLSLYIGRWETFAKNAVAGDTVYIFECAFLQNHLNELLLYHEPAYDYILDYFMRLSQVFANLDPVIIYLDQADNDETIRRAADERISDDASVPNWIDRVIDY